MLTNDKINNLFTVLIACLMFFLIIPKAGIMPVGEQAYLFVASVVSFFLAVGFIGRGLDSRLKTDIYWFLPIVVFVLIVFFQQVYSQAWVIDVLITHVSLMSEFLNKPSFRNLGYFLSFYIFAYCVANLSKKQISVLIGCLSFIVVAQAVFGLWHFMSEQESVLGLWDKQFYLLDATGTFVNRNHFSGFFAIAVPLILGGLVSARSEENRMSLQVAIFVVSIVLVSGVAVLSSHSRMGFTVFLIGILAWWLFHSKSINSKHSKNRVSQNLIYASVIFILLLFLIWFGVDEIVARFSQLENGNSRFDVWQAIMSLPKEVWLFGIGVSNFSDVFAMVKPEYFTAQFLYAHNDYLEFVLELGIIFSSFLVLSFVLLWLRCKPKARLSGVRVGAVASLVAVAVHSIVDFNLQIPANALFVALAFGVLMNSNVSSSDKLDENRSKVRKQRTSPNQRKVKKAKRPKLSVIEN